MQSFRGRVAPFVAGIRRRVAEAFGTEPPADVAPPATETTRTAGVAGDSSAGPCLETLWRTAQTRRAAYADLLEMDQDPILSLGLDVIADCATGYEPTDEDAFAWKLADGAPEAAWEVLRDLTARCSLRGEAWQIARNVVQFGDEFREVVVDEKLRVVGFVALPVCEVRPNLDPRGNQLPGWTQEREGMLGLEGAVEFDHWQVVHFRYGNRRGFYGTGLLEPARRDWRRLGTIEDGLAIARVSRAYDRAVHRVPVNREWPLAQQIEAVKNYRHKILERRSTDREGSLVLRPNPMRPESDIYLPEDGSKRAGVDLLTASNAQLRDIDDVRYHQAKVYARLKVPAKYLGATPSSGALTDGSLTSEEVQFARVLRQVQASVREGLLRLGAFALRVQGFDPIALGLGLDMARIATENYLTEAKVAFTNAQAAEIYATLVPGGLPPRVVVEHYMQLSAEERETVLRWAEDHEGVDAEEGTPGATGDRDAGDEPGLSPAARRMRKVRERRVRARAGTAGDGYDSSQAARVEQVLEELDGLVAEELARRRSSRGGNGGDRG